jgi:hypothetical protein
MAEDDSGPDGRSYVDAVVAAGQRSRTIISIIIVLMVLTFTSLRINYEPAWTYLQIQLYEDLYDCLKQNNLADDRCTPVRIRISDMEGRVAQADDITEFAGNVDIKLRGQFGTDQFTTLNATKINELDARIKALVEKDTTGAVISIPVLGSQIDFNDLWIVSGGVMLCLLYMLYASIEQERRNVEFIASEKKQYLTLMFMNLVLPSPQMQENAASTFIKRLAWLSPSLLYIYFFWADLYYYYFSFVLLGRQRSVIEYCVETIFVLFGIYYNILCLNAQTKLERAVFKARGTAGAG